MLPVSKCHMHLYLTLHYLSIATNGAVHSKQLKQESDALWFGKATGKENSDGENTGGTVQIMLFV